MADMTHEQVEKEVAKEQKPQVKVVTTEAYVIGRLNQIESKISALEEAILKLCETIKK